MHLGNIFLLYNIILCVNIMPITYVLYNKRFITDYNWTETHWYYKILKIWSIHGTFILEGLNSSYLNLNFSQLVLNYYKICVYILWYDIVSFDVHIMIHICVVGGFGEGGYGEHLIVVLVFARSAFLVSDEKNQPFLLCIHILLLSA